MFRLAYLLNHNTTLKSKRSGDKDNAYQKCTVFKPTGLSHIFLTQDSCAAPGAAVLWNLLPACLKVALEVWAVKKGVARVAPWRKRGREARRRVAAEGCIVERGSEACFVGEEVSLVFLWS